MCSRLRDNIPGGERIRGVEKARQRRPACALISARQQLHGGAAGVVYSLDAGPVIWSRNAAGDTAVKVPELGVRELATGGDDRVVVAASGRLAAYPSPQVSGVGSDPKVARGTARRTC